MPHQPRLPGGPGARPPAKAGLPVRSPSRVRLRRDVARAVRAGHPWIWAEALAPSPGLEAGAVVDVVDPSGRFLARGLWDPHSPIAVRVFTRREDEPLDGPLVRDRLLAAAGRRAPLFDPSVTDAWRLVHGEADGLPGVVCDRYADTAVLRFDAAGVAVLRPPVVDALASLPGIRNIVERGLGRTRRRATAGLRDQVTVLAGRAPRGPLVVRENGLRYEVDLLAGHKTGFYVDQRDNRALVRSLAAGRRVLDLFSYTGGFAVAAAAGGAAEVLAVDVSRPAAAAARRNLARNGADPAACRAVAADVFDFLASPAARRPWDLVVVDPPSFAPSRAALPRALAAYRRLNAAVFSLARPGALVLTCSCSSHVREADFLEAIRASAGDAGVRLRVREVRGAAPDHPVVRWFPEGHYLKAVLVEVGGRRQGGSRPVPACRFLDPPGASRYVAGRE